MNYICKSFGYTFCAVCSALSAYTFFLDLPSIINMDKYTYNIKNLFIFSVLSFSALLLIFMVISFTLKSLQNLFLGFYYGLFYNPKHDKMHIKIDQDDIIRESFMELKNGERIPVFISRIVTHKPESNVGENNE